ncbi:MAG: hypothetical protein HYR80_08410 [Nitrospirae bacterium]|nr:hypothetical protein [Nitrospirota bacterium]
MKMTLHARVLNLSPFKIFFTVGLGLLLGIVHTASTSAKELPLKVAVVGVLNRVVLIGGETTGWMVQLNREQEILGNATLEIDVDPKDQSIERFREKRVKITGDVMTRIGRERGNYPVIELETIQFLHPEKE